ncbi:MAG: hypothetical protein E6344_05715 [Clostridium sp.]|nr:hypothetical protein [Clostridium sp.]MDU7083169.1 hypothetical protein [Clostridium sp.]
MGMKVERVSIIGVSGIISVLVTFLLVSVLAQVIFILGIDVNVQNEIIKVVCNANNLQVHLSGIINIAIFIIGCVIGNLITRETYLKSSIKNYSSSL